MVLSSREEGAYNCVDGANGNVSPPPTKASKTRQAKAKLWKTILAQTIAPRANALDIGKSPWSPTSENRDVVQDEPVRLDAHLLNASRRRLDAVC